MTVNPPLRKKAGCRQAGPDSPIKSLAKGITWRITGTLDTVLLAWFFTGEPLSAVSIGGFELLTKMTLFYFHERAWNRLPSPSTPRQEAGRGFCKSISWRSIGTVDTILLAFLITGQLAGALKLGFAEVFTKLVLYNFHEWAWNRLELGALRLSKRSVNS